MAAASSHLERFLRAVHRRMVVLRICERVGLAVLAGCILALLLMPILIWRGQETMPLVMGCGALGIFSGLLWGLARRPGVLAAAVEADRQLKLADLLGTALFLARRREPLDEFGRTIVATAEARCAALSPSAVIVNRIGARGWGGIALAAAMVLTVALVTAGDREAHATGEQVAGASAPAMRSWLDAQSPRGGTTSTNEPDYRRVNQGPAADDEQRLGAASPDRNATAAIEKGNAGEATAAQAGTGAGSAQAGRDGDPGKGIEVAPGGNDSKTGAGAASSGGTGTAKSGANAASSGAAGAGTDVRPAPVWTSPTWLQDRAAALRAVEGGAVPVAYRGIVRDYFERK
jgi:hypothetical protein